MYSALYHQISFGIVLQLSPSLKGQRSLSFLIFSLENINFPLPPSLTLHSQTRQLKSKTKSNTIQCSLIESGGCNDQVSRDHWIVPQAFTLWAWSITNLLLIKSNKYKTAYIHFYLAPSWSQNNNKTGSQRETAFLKKIMQPMHAALKTPVYHKQMASPQEALLCLCDYQQVLCPTCLQNILMVPALEFGEFCLLRYFMIGRGITAEQDLQVLVSRRIMSSLPFFPGLLHGAYKDWNELIENKETKGVWGGE